MRRFSFPLLVALVAALAGCGGGTETAEPPETVAETAASEETVAETATPEKTPTSPTRGRWVGSAPGGGKFAFTVSARAINNIALPAAKCGAGFGSTVTRTGGFPFKGKAFEAETVGLLPYTVYDKKSGRSYTAQDATTITGTFTSGTTAKGSIVTKVQSGGKTIDTCRQRWTAKVG